MHTQLLIFGVFIALTIVQAFPPRTDTQPENGPIVEGDIILTESLKHLMERDATKKREYHLERSKWNKVGRKVIVPYTINGLGSTQFALLKTAFLQYAAQTCVEFTQRNGEADYIEFTAGEKSESYVGKQGGKQALYIAGHSESLADVLHEIMHALGFLHEQSRVDRDSYVEVIYKNIQDGRANQFTIYQNVDLARQSYDIHSLMHYKTREFSKNGLATIVVKGQPETPLGNDNFFSIIDVLQINTIYGCPERYRQVWEMDIDVFTSNEWWSGTDAAVYITIICSDAEDSGEIKLQGDFESNSHDHFEKFFPKLCVKRITVYQDETGSFPAWHVEKIVIKNKYTGQVYNFPCGCWIEGSAKTLTPS